MKHDSVEEPMQLFRRLDWLNKYGLVQEQLRLDVFTHYIKSEDNKRADWLSRPELTHKFFADPLCSDAVCIQVPRGWVQSWTK